MISICIATKRVGDVSNVSDNISKTIGLPEKHFEILIYPYTDEPLSKIYNKMLKQTKHNIVVFVDNNVELLTPFWGVKLISLYKRYYDYSMIGVGGSKDVPDSGIWYKSNHSYGIIEFVNTDSEIETTKFSNDLMGTIEEVKLLCGGFLAINKKLFDGFDEDFVSEGFYAIGTSLHTSYRKGVTTDILIRKEKPVEDNDVFENDRLLLLNKFNTEINTYCQPKIIPFITKVEPYESKSVSIIIYFDGDPTQQLKPIIQSIYGSHYPEYNVDVYVLNNSGDTLKIDRDIKIINYIGEKEDVIFDLMKKMDTDYIMVWDSNLQPFGDVLFETMFYASENKVVTSRIHLFENSLRSQGQVIGIAEDGTHLLRNNNFAKGFKYDFEPIEQIPTTTSEFFIIPSIHLKDIKLIKSNIDNSMSLLVLSLNAKGVETICVNSCGLKNHKQELPKNETMLEFHKDSELIKKILKENEFYKKN